MKQLPEENEQSMAMHGKKFGFRLDQFLYFCHDHTENSMIQSIFFKFNLFNQMTKIMSQ